jgi:hypothetical protein
MKSGGAFYQTTPRTLSVITDSLKCAVGINGLGDSDGDDESFGGNHGLNKQRHGRMP